MTLMTDEFLDLAYGDDEEGKQRYIRVCQKADASLDALVEEMKKDANVRRAGILALREISHFVTAQWFEDNYPDDEKEDLTRKR